MHSDGRRRFCAQRVAVPALGERRPPRRSASRPASPRHVFIVFTAKSRRMACMTAGTPAMTWPHVANARKLRRHGDWILDELHRSGWDARHPPPRGRPRIARRA